MSVQKVAFRGEKQTVSTEKNLNEDKTELKESYRIGVSMRGGGSDHTVDLNQDDLVELVFEDDTVWYSNADHLEELFPEAAQQRGSSTEAFKLPSTLQSDEAERGIVGDIALKVLNIFVKKQVQGKVHELAKELEKKQLEGFSGLYQLNRNFSLQKFEPQNTSQPYLLFLHGTSSSTLESFGGLINSDVWSTIEKTYGTRILALQHETLTKSPLQNAVELIKALFSDEKTQQIELHIISHSRGGLIGDILSRFSNSGNDRHQGFDKNEIKYLNETKRQTDIGCIKELQKLLANKKLTVSKFIRVACPASGTILASKRIDKLLNITMNLVGYGTGVGANPLYASFKNLIAAVIDSKNEVDVLPGLEAMNPKSPFIKALNSPGTEVTIESPVQVISGNCTIKPELRALLVIASKLFYLEDNDLVVNTHAMYQGAKRAKGQVHYFLDEEGMVDHFHYFKNPSTQKVIRNALLAKGNGVSPDFSFIQQELLKRGGRQAALGFEGGVLYKNKVTGKKPIVVLLPGIMGSNLSKKGTKLWINYKRFITGKLPSLKIDEKEVEALSIVKTSYWQLEDHLSSEYDVVTFPFDWRKKLTDSTQSFEDKIKELLAVKQPIKIVAHSMGGVLVRDFIIQHPKTWQQLNQSSGFKLLFLGVPLGGSFRIPAFLFGQDSIIDKLDRIDIFHTKKKLLGVFCKFPGILSLLPLSDPDDDFGSISTWEKMGDPLGKEWPLPIKKDLEEFAKHRDKVLAQEDKIDYSNMVYIAGKDKATPCGYRIDQTNAGKELEFLYTGEGDQSVTWESGIPKKMIENDSVYYVPVTHGALANEPDLFPGIFEILSQGFTYSLSKTRPMIRSTERLFKAPEQYDFDLSEQGVINTILGLEAKEKKEEFQIPIQVSACNGDLRYARYPVLAGHFLNDGILNAEKKIDQYLQGALTERHMLGLYPGEIGSNEQLVCNADFRGAIIVGLGKFGELTAFQLSKTTEQGIMRYLLNLNGGVSLNNQPSYHRGIIGISSLVIGCGYGGIPVDNSVRAIIQGVYNANKKIKNLYGKGAKCVEAIEFIDLYEDTTLSCFYSLNKLESEKESPLKISVNPKKIRTLLGSRKRLPTDLSENWWKRITVQLKDQTNAKDDDGIRCLLFNASTGGAREEQRELFSSEQIAEQLIDQASTQNHWTPALARTIFELLIPNDFKETLQKQGNINWILDKNTAWYPWELLQDSSSNAIPLSVSAGMIRQLATQDYRSKIKEVAKNRALVIADPNIGGFLNQLPGANLEGSTVSGSLRENGFETTTIINGYPPEIIQSLFRDDYKIIHLAGHGIFNEKSPENSGMVIGKNTFLSTREISQMSTVPELVFVNCCHIGKTDTVAEEYYRNRYKLAANIGVQLIDNGVKAVVVAGWAISDAAALDFTKVFYEKMLDDYTFCEAIQKARKYIYEKYKGTNTWGAYQCYGDPFYRFRNTWQNHKPYEPEFLVSQEAEIELGNLTNDIETGNYSDSALLERLAIISTAVDRANLRTASITEMEASLYANLCEFGQSVERFKLLMEMEDASFTVSTLEKYCNVRAKKYVFDYQEGNATSDESIELMRSVINDLNNLLQFSPTAERQALLGSAYRRLGIVTSDTTKKKLAHLQAAECYRKSFVQKESVYTYTNWLELGSILVLSGEKKWGKGQLPPKGKALEELDTMLHSLDDVVEKMQYWDLVSKFNIKLCKLMLTSSTKDNTDGWKELLEDITKVWDKAGPKGKKVAEIEHLDLLLDALTIAPENKVKSLVENINQLKVELERIA